MNKILILLALVAVSSIHYSVADDCSQGGPSQMMNWESGAWLNVFPQLDFGCSGVVRRWEFYAYQPGTFMAGIWRPEGSDSFRFVGANTITVESEGVHVIDIPCGEQISVEQGDVIGTHYPASAHASQGGVVPYEDKKFDRTEGITDDMLQPIHNKNTRDEDLTPGETVVQGVTNNVQRIPAITAFTGQNAGDCSQGGPSQMLNWESGAWLNIFPQLSFSCAGVVWRYEFYAYQPGTFMAGIWRPEGSDGFRFIGANTITVENEGIHTVDIPCDEQISVEEGDVIGTHYPASAHASQGGVVPYEDKKFDRTEGITDDMLQPIHNKNTRDEALTPGETVVQGVTNNVQRIPALTAFVG